MAVTERRYDLYGTAFRADPYAVFDAMRRNDPVFRQPGFDGETMIWFVTRYEDVAAMLVDERSCATHGWRCLPKGWDRRRRRQSRRSTTTC